MNKVQEIIYDLLPGLKKSRRSGWVYFNAPCCSKFERSDSKQRGNMLFEGDTIVYNCFNCHTRWVWSPNFYMSKKMEEFLRELGISNEGLFELRTIVREMVEGANPNEIIAAEFKKREYRDIPKNYKSINESFKNGETCKTFNDVWSAINYRNNRLLEFTDLYWADKQSNFLIPCYEYGKVVGYSLRSLSDNTKSKYIHYIPNGYIFNHDLLMNDRKYEIITEGQLDAISLNCISILHNTIKPDRLKRLLPYTKTKELIILADRDKAGKKLVKQIIEEDLPFSVSFPNWTIDIKDAEEAVKKYGRLYSIQSIINSRIKDKDEIHRGALKWFNI